MYVREAKKREEVWLLDQLEAFGFDDPAFRSRDYVIAVDEDAGERVGFGRVRTHGGESPYCEVTSLGVREDWRGRGFGAAIVQKLLALADEQDCGAVYVFTEQTGYLEQFGFEGLEEDALTDQQRERLDVVRETIESEAVAMVVDVDEFSVPRRLARRFESDEEAPEERPEDFGIDPDTATYKYDTGR
ncbi:MAG: GNAT family N-acetyltransferase [Halanaeroarchaeum sp.]